MAGKRKRGDSIIYTIKRKPLERPVYLTFDDEADGDAYVARLEQMLARGIVPPELLERRDTVVTISDAIRDYRRGVHVAAGDLGCLDVIDGRIGNDQLVKVDYGWAERWVRSMKLEHNLAPGTIRHHVGALARCFDWAAKAGKIPGNPLRQLPRRYSTYSDADVVPGEVERRIDEHRERRLEDGEEDRIRAVLAGAKRDDRQRALELAHADALACVFDLVLEGGLRLQECYMLRRRSVDLGRSTIFVEYSKTGKKRQVPITSVMRGVFERYFEGRTLADEELVFPWWDGDMKSREKVTSRLSKQFWRIFEAAQSDGLTFHDLRHEAACRYFERTQMSDAQIMKVFGWTSVKMLLRYANLRGSHLAGLVW